MAKQDIKAGAAFVELFVKSGKFVAGLRTAGARLKAWGESAKQVGAAVQQVGAQMTAIGGAASTAIGAATAAFVRAGVELDKLSKQTGVSVENLSRMGFAASKLSIDFDDVAGAVEELNIRMGETIRDGTGPMAEAFQQLGLDAEQLSKLPLPERLGRIADALNGLESNATRGFLADEIFGGDAFKILPLLREGATGIAALADEADRLGATQNGESVKMAVRLRDVFGEVYTVLSATVREIVTALAPSIQKLGRFVADLAGGIRIWVENNRELIVQAAELAVKVTAVGVSLIAVGTAIKAVGVAAGIAGGTLSTLVGLLTAPLGLTVFAAAGAAAFALSDDMGTVLSEVKTSWSAIVAAFKAGDLESSFKILASTIKNIWSKMFASLMRDAEIFALRASQSLLAKIGKDDPQYTRAREAAIRTEADLKIQQSDRAHRRLLEQIDKERTEREAVEAAGEDPRKKAERYAASLRAGAGKGGGAVVRHFEEALGAGGSVGTFSATALGRLGGGGGGGPVLKELRRAADANEKVAKNTEEMKKKKGPKFG